MFNLIKKDLLLQKKVFLFGIFYTMIIIISFQQIGSPMSAANVVVLSYIMLQSSCAYDDKNKADILLNSLPLKRNTIVFARYLSTFVFAAITILYYILLTGVIKILKLPIKVYPATFEGIAGAIFALIVLISIYLPIYFKWGYIKSKIFNLIMFFVVFFGVSVIAPKVKEYESFYKIDAGIDTAVIIFAVMIILLVNSYLISVKLYGNREM